MVRPKKGEQGYAQANLKWRKTMMAKYGGADGLRKKMQETGRLGGVKSCNGGFASDKVGEDGLTGKQRARVAGAIGGARSRRGPDKHPRRKKAQDGRD